MNQDHLSGLHLCPHDERLVGREVGGAEGGPLSKAESLIKREDEGAVGDDELGVGAGILSGDEDPLADVERADVAADVLDVAGSVAARNVRKIRKSENNTLSRLL